MESEDDDDDFSEPDSEEALLESESTTFNYVLSFEISDSLRQTFILILIVGNFLCINCAVTLMLLSWFVKNSLQKQITFLQDYYQPKAVPTILVVSGFTMFAASVLGIKASIGGRLIDSEEEAKSAAFFFHIYWIAAAVTAFTICVAAFVCLLEVQTLRQAFGKGLKGGMKKYFKGGMIKSEIDTLQLEFKCCGVEGYKDWFEVAWIDVKFIDLKNNPELSKKVKAGKFYTKDVPFSCCRMDIIRPCVDSRIEDIQYHSKYSYPQDLTLEKNGCKEAVANFLSKGFYGTGVFAFICLLIWIGMAAIGRYLHTSIRQISNGEAPVGWLIPIGKSGEVNMSDFNIAKNIKLADIKMPKNMKLPDIKMPKNMKLPDIKMPKNMKLPDMKMPKNMKMPKFKKGKKKRKDIPVAYKKGKNQDEDSDEVVDIDFERG